MITLTSARHADFSRLRGLYHLWEAILAFARHVEGLYDLGVADLIYVKRVRVHKVDQGVLYDLRKRVGGIR